MGALITIILLWLTLFISGVLRLSRRVSVVALALVTIMCLYFGFAGIILGLIIIALAFSFLFVIEDDSLRKTLLTKHIFKNTKKKVKAISETEKVALSAGDSWLEADIFQGKIDFEAILATKISTLTKEEQDFLDNETTELCQMLDDWKIINVDKNLDKATWKFIKDKGFLGLVIAPEYGGKGFSAAAHSAIVKKIATKSMTAAISVMVPNSLGPGELITNYGTLEQKKEILPKLAHGKEIPCFGLTGTYAGSDATSMTDIGIVCKNNKDELGIKLNFAKRYITLAPIATIIGIAFKLEDPDNLLEGTGREGITLCLVSKSHPGVKTGNRHLPLGIPFMNGPVTGKDVFVPIDAIIGGQGNAGMGWKMLVECLAIGRSISLPAICDAYNSKSLLETSAYAVLREQFNSPILNFEGVSARLGAMVGYTYMSRATRLMTLTAVDNELKPGVASAIAKYHLTELSRKVITNAMDIHGGKAIMSGKLNYLANAYQGLPISITVEGANILTRNLIIFGQGAVRSHPYIFTELESLENDDLDKFDNALLQHIDYMFDNWCQQGFTAVTAGIFTPAPKSKLKKYYKRVYRLSVSFAAVADFALVSLGSKLKTKERLSARLGDVMSNLYMALATLKHFHDNGEPENEIKIAIWAVETCLHEAEEALLNFFSNYPNKVLGKTLKLKVFPWGRSNHRPKDVIEHEIAKLISYDKNLRSSFAVGTVFETEQSSVLEAYDLLIENGVAFEKIKAAIYAKKLPKLADSFKQVELAYENNIITESEYKLLKDVEQKRSLALAVDIFNHDLTEIISHA